MPRRRTPEQLATRAFHQACDLYAAMAETLGAIVARLRREIDTAEPLSAAEVDVLKTHQKTVLMVLDFEAQLFKRRLSEAPAASRGVDLAAARREIVGRLARLDDPGGPAEAS